MAEAQTCNIVALEDRLSRGQAFSCILKSVTTSSRKSELQNVKYLAVKENAELQELLQKHCSICVP